MASSKSLSTMQSSSSSLRSKPLLGDDSDDDDINKPAAVQNWFVHIIFCGLPILAMSMILFTFFLILEQDVSYESLQEDHISGRLANYENYVGILIPMIIGGTSMFIVTKARNIQIQVYITRQRQSKQSSLVNSNEDESARTKYQPSAFFWSINTFAAFVNILAYAGFICVGIFKTGEGQAMVTESVSVHRVAAITYFIGVYIYMVLHTFMVIQQEDRYPAVFKILFTLLTMGGIGCITVYAISEKTTGEDEEAQHLFEWLAAIIAAVYVAFFSVLFHIDPVDDELIAFFSCGCCGRRRSRLAAVKKQKEQELPTLSMS